MGTDNLHHRRKARTAADLRRREARKNPYERILIVCEGEATEINYFSALINALRLTTVNAVAVPSPSTCPEANVCYALDAVASGRWDTVFCVFDKDTHAKFKQAIEKLENAGGSVRAGYSVPCFEYWLLLHFTYTDKSFYGHPGRSAGQCVVQELRVYIENYTKGARNVYAQTCDALEQAKKFALRANRSAKEGDETSSMTLVVDAVQALQNLRKEMDS